MKKFTSMSNDELERVQPRTENEADALRQEVEFRTWCQEFDEDYGDEEAREHFLAGQVEVETFWDDMDEQEREGWEHMIINSFG